MEMEDGAQIHIIFGQPFLTIAGAMINVKNGKLSLPVGDETLEFNLAQAIVAPTLEDSYY